MNRLALGILAAMGATVVGVEQAFPGWEIDVQHRGTFVRRERHVFQGHRYKEENVDENGRLTTVAIFDLDVERLTVVRHSARTYFSATFREWDERQRAHDAQLMRSLQKELNRMPARDREIRKQRDEAERLEYCQGRWTVQPSDQSETIAGYMAIRHDLLVDGRPVA